MLKEHLTALKDRQIYNLLQIIFLRQVPNFKLIKYKEYVKLFLLVQNKATVIILRDVKCPIENAP